MNSLEQKINFNNELTKGAHGSGIFDARLHTMQIDGYESRGLFQWINSEKRPHLEYLIYTAESAMFNIQLQARSFYDGARVKLFANYEEIGEVGITRNIFEFFDTENYQVQLNEGFNLIRLELVGDLAVEVATVTIR